MHTEHTPTDPCPLGDRYQRYWDKLSLPEKQMQIDVEGLYSMDLQSVATALAARIKADQVIDAFCGIGGAAIAFARAGKDVLAIEIDPQRLEMARHNARMFGVDRKVNFQLGDALDILQKSSAALYLDPPWGGPSYGRLDRFSLSHFSPNGEVLIRKGLTVSLEIYLKLPKNFAFDELDGICRPIEVIENEVNGRLEYYTAVFKGG